MYVCVFVYTYIGRSAFENVTLEGRGDQSADIVKIVSVERDEQTVKESLIKKIQNVSVESG